MDLSSSGEVFGNGKCFYIQNLSYEYLEESDIIRSPIRMGDVKKTHADISNMKTLLDYEPQWPFEKGLIDTFEWWDNLC